MLIRISLILAILAGLGVCGLNFTKLKERMETTQNERNKERSDKEIAQKDLSKTRSDLKMTSDKLKQTQTLLASTTDERDSALKKLDDKTKVAEKLAQEKETALKQLDDANGKLEAFRLTGLDAKQIVEMKNSFSGLQANLEEDKILIGSLQKKNKKLQADLDQYIDPDRPIAMPATMRGEVLVVDPKWNFVVLSVGEDKGVVEQGELLVNRNGKLVAKVKVRSVQKDRSVANIMPGWELGEVHEHDQVIPAHPAS
jgi:hypothetical protein